MNTDKRLTALDRPATAVYPVTSSFTAPDNFKAFDSKLATRSNEDSRPQEWPVHTQLLPSPP